MLEETEEARQAAKEPRRACAEAEYAIRVLAEVIAREPSIVARAFQNLVSAIQKGGDDEQGNSV